MATQPRAQTDVEVHISGPLFQQGPDVVNENMKAAIAEIVEEGTQEAKRLASPFRRSGKYVESLRGKVSKSGKSGRIKAYGGPARMPYSRVHELGRFIASTSRRVPGHFVLKSTQQKLEREIAPRIFAKHMDSAVQELNR